MGRRMGCRDTWIAELPEQFRPFFVLGNAMIPTPWVFEGDVLYVRCADDYESLSAKVRLGLTALLDRFDPPWIFKCDDDTWLNPWQFASIPFSEYDHTGYFIHGLETGFASGAGYGLSRRAAEAAIMGLGKSPPSTPEDVMVSGIVAALPGATRYHVKGFRPLSRENWKPSLLGHWIQNRNAMMTYHEKGRQHEFGGATP